MFRSIHYSDIRQYVWQNQVKVSVLIVLVLLCIVVILACQNSQLFAAGNPSDPFHNINQNSRYAIYYGDDYEPSHLAKLAQMDLVVLEPNSNALTPAIVNYLQEQGVIVLAYISIGEDKVDIDFIPTYLGEKVPPMGMFTNDQHQPLHRIQI